MCKNLSSLICGLALWLPLMAIASPEPSSASTVSPNKYINVSIELHGLDDSAKLIRAASQDLANKVAQIELEPDKLSPEQLQALQVVMQEARQLLKAFDDSVGQAGPAIEDMRSAANHVVADTLLSVYETAIDPTIQSVDSSVSKWIIISFIGLLMLLALAGYFIYLSTRQIRAMALVLKSITEDYEIVPRRLANSDAEQEF